MIPMTYLCICLYCMLQIAFMIRMDNRRRKIRSVQEYYFLILLVILLISFTADIISSFSHVPDWFFPFVVLGVYTEIVLNTVLLPIYFLYVCLQITGLDMRLRKRLLRILVCMAGLCSAIVISNAFHGLIFYYDSAGGYHRGRLFLVPMILQFIIMLLIEIFIIAERKHIEASYFRSLLFFLIFPMIGWALQILVYGLPFSLISAAFAAQVVFTNIQNRSMDTDYLTGVFNRQSLDNYMQHKISTASEGRVFSAILLDLDNFKLINDEFGHVEGDRALIDTSIILKNAISPGDFIARYGGDEFCIVLDGNRYALERAVSRINSSREVFNRTKQRPYRISFSIGSAVFDPESRDTQEIFLRKMDMEMYEEKRRHKLQQEQKKADSKTAAGTMSEKKL